MVYIIQLLAYIKDIQIEYLEINSKLDSILPPPPPPPPKKKKGKKTKKK